MRLRTLLLAAALGLLDAAIGEVDLAQLPVHHPGEQPTACVGRRDADQRDVRGRVLLSCGSGGKGPGRASAAPAAVSSGANRMLVPVVRPSARAMAQLAIR